MQKAFEFGGAQGKQVSLNLAMANRHGLITNASGSGKTVTLQTLVEGFSHTPADIPASIAGQLGNRMQHAFRAFTP